MTNTPRPKWGVSDTRREISKECYTTSTELPTEDKRTGARGRLRPREENSLEHESILGDVSCISEV